ncbi:hypothetical protein AB5J56_40100 [Streptomyces sp. R21]|uniref:Uncharacterized protein n=1 Tax=Streptomyces sp. R21 TaxID=3238627 RepID=A0AB39PN67_9ACTN
MTRRQAIVLGAVTAGTVAFEVDGSTAAVPETATASRTGPARERFFNDGWRFLRGDAQSPSLLRSATVALPVVEE